MSESRFPWTEDEKALLQELKTQHAKALIVDLTALFNDRNGRKRTEDAIRGQLKSFKKLAREKECIEKIAIALQSTGGVVERQPWSATHSQGNPVMGILIPAHPSMSTSSPAGDYGCPQTSVLNHYLPESSWASEAEPVHERYSSYLANDVPNRFGIWDGFNDTDSDMWNLDVASSIYVVNGDATATISDINDYER